MGKHKRDGSTSLDLDVGIGRIIPSTQEAFHQDDHLGSVRKEERAAVSDFKKDFLKLLDSECKACEKHFPVDKEVFVVIIQFFQAEATYRKRDVDNMAKTVLDSMKGTIYEDDGLVRTLLVAKKIEHRVPCDFAYIGVKILGPAHDVEALKASGFERSVTLFQTLRKRGDV